MTQQSEAQRLADNLQELFSLGSDVWKAAAELQKLQELHKQLQDRITTMKAVLKQAVETLEAENADTHNEPIFNYQKSIITAAKQALEKKICHGEPRQIFAPEKFNDDDLYVYDSNTLEIKSILGSYCRQGYQVPEGMTADIGLKVKNLGLWIKVEGPTDAELAAIARQLACLSTGLENGSSAAEFAAAKLARAAHNLIHGG